MTAQPVLRQETPDDVKAVFEVHQLAFGQPNEGKLVDALRCIPEVFVPELSIVATADSSIVGHVLLTKVGIRDDTGALFESLGLAPVGVRPAWQQKGVGAMLIRKGLEVAKYLGFRSVIVLGAASYYPRFGFEPACKWHIKAPFAVPSDVFMAIELEHDGLKGVSGTVVYPKAFEGV